MSDQLPPLPDDVRALLDAATPPTPSGAFEAKVLAKVSATLGVLPPGGGPSSGGPSSGGPSSGGPSSGGPSSAGPSSAGPAGGASAGGASAGGAAASGASGAMGGAAAGGGVASGAVAVTKTTLALGSALLLAAGVAGGVVLGRTALSPEPVVVQAPPPVVAPPPAQPSPREAPTPEPPRRVEAPEAPPSAPVKPIVAKPSRPAEVTPPKEPTPPASRDTQLSQERALLEVARTALAKGDVAGTLDAVERHAREFPNGRLAEEREVLFIQALVQADRKDEAARHAEVFRRQFPDSLMLPAVDAALSQ